MESSKILTLNSDAADLIGKGSYAEAAKILRTVLTDLLEDFGTDSKDYCDSGPSDLLLQRIQIDTVSCNELASCKYTSSTEISHFPMYGKAIRLIYRDHTSPSSPADETTTSPPSSTLEYKHLLSVAVLYNMALTYHSIALRNIRRQCATLHRALKLYQMCLDVLGSANGSFPKFIEMFFTMATVNNMGNIYSQFCRYEEAQHCITVLYQILHSCRDSGFGLALGPDDYLHFHMNVILLHGQDFLCAPSA